MSIRKQYDTDLEALKAALVEMGSNSAEAVEAALEALCTADAEAAQKIVKGDSRINNMERDIEHRCMTLLLRQQPVAGDLRRISTAMKVVTDIERMGDHASDIAEIIPHLVTVRKEGDPAVSQAIAMGRKAYQMIETIAIDPEVGSIYKGKVVSIKPFGAFVEIAPGRDGLVHISKLDKERVEQVEDVVSVGDAIIVKVMDIKDGKISLSRKDALEELEACTGETYAVIHIMGGGVKDSLLCQLTADYCQRLVAAGPVEATVYGNAAIQMLALGILKTPAEARRCIAASESMQFYHAGAFPASSYEKYRTLLK